jgi:hypothetical protein
MTVFTGDKLFSYRSGHLDKQEIFLPENKVLHVELDNDLRFSSAAQYSVLGREIVHDKSYDKCYLKPLVTIQTSDNGEIYLTIEKRTVLPDFDDDYYGYIYYDWEFDDSLLLLSEYFSIDEDDIWHGPGVKVSLFLPEGQRFRISREIGELIDEFDNPLVIYDEYYNRQLQIRNHEIVVRD